MARSENDLGLLKILQEDGRASFSAIAKEKRESSSVT
ncbi:MAG: AsnC family protein [Candidatus Bathyarchaeota archaeon]|nr:AsnC family protein [Candidatus Bathyarchaeota archaeon]